MMAIQVNIITEEAFIERLLPQPNHINLHASFDFGNGGCLYETYGEELQAISRVEGTLIWTITDCDDGLCIISGCQSARKVDPISASNVDPYVDDQHLDRPALAGVAEGEPGAGDGAFRL